LGSWIDAIYYSKLDATDAGDEFMPILAPQGDVCCELVDLRNDASGEAKVRFRRQGGCAASIAWLESVSPVMLAI
jgi:hypothetical protein